MTLKVTTAAGTDKFDWSDDGGSTWKATGVAMTGAAQTLNRGTTVTWAATTGHTLNDAFDFTVYPDGLTPNKARCVVETADVRSREDGTDPSATVGQLRKTQVTEDDFFDIDGINNIKKVRFIQASSAASLDVHYYR